MDATLPARRDFLQLASQALVQLGADSMALDAPRLNTDAKICIEFAIERVSFAFVHDLDPQIGHLMLVRCALGPLPAGVERESCMRMLEANYELSPLLLTGFAIDETRNAVYTQSCATSLWDDDGIVALIEGMAALALRWRNGGSLDAESLGRFANHAMAVPPSALA